MFNERGFTLIEMLIVLLVISILLLLFIPNLTNQTDRVNDMGCDALVQVVQAQADAYYLEHKTRVNDIQILVDNDYLDEEQITCGEKEITVVNGKAKAE